MPNAYIHGCTSQFTYILLLLRTPIKIFISWPCRGLIAKYIAGEAALTHREELMNLNSGGDLRIIKKAAKYSTVPKRVRYSLDFIRS